MSTIYPATGTAHSQPVIERTSVSARIEPGRDRIRWGPIIAGIFSAITALVVLGLLGTAIGLSSVDAKDRPSTFGIGAGIWGIVSALVAFFFGGWMAAWGGRETGEHNGVTQGVMVWMVAIPLTLYLAATSVGAATRAAGSALATGANAASNLAGAAAQDPQARDQARGAAASLTTQSTSADVQGRVNELKNSVTPERVEEAAGTAAKGAWGTLAATMLGLLAAALGGFVGGDHHKRSRGTHGTVRVD